MRLCCGEGSLNVRRLCLAPESERPGTNRRLDYGNRFDGGSKALLNGRGGAKGTKPFHPFSPFRTGRVSVGQGKSKLTDRKRALREVGK